MDKIVHELSGLLTDVFYHTSYEQEDFGVNVYKYRYHCAHCSVKGTFAHKVQQEVLYNENHEVAIWGLFEGVTYLTKVLEKCPTCKADWNIGQSDRQQRTAQKLRFDNGDIMYLNQFVHPRLADAQPVVEQVKLRICASTGKMRVTFNEKVVYDVMKIKTSLTNLREHFSEVPTEEEYFISRNARLRDLLVYARYVGSFYMYVTENHRRRMYYAYDKHGMKGAYRAILNGNGNKQLYKIAWSQLDSVSILNEMLNKIQADQLSSILNYVAEHRITYDLFDKINHLLGLGYSSLKIKNIAKSGNLVFLSHWVCRDATRMYKTLLERTNGSYELPKHKDVHELHDLLMRDINQVEDAQAKLINLPVTDLEECHIGVYSVKLAKTAHDLNLLGRRLNICVAGYRDVVLQGSRIIAYVTQGSNMVACLEVQTSSSRLIQAKLARNNYVKNDPEIECVVFKWVKQNKLAANTFDVDFKVYSETPRKINIEFQEESSEMVKRPETVNDLEEDDLPF